VKIAALDVGIGKLVPKAVHCCTLKVNKDSLWIWEVIDHHNIDQCIKKAVVSGFFLVW